MIDPNYLKQARDAIDELAEEVRQVHDMIRVERNDHHFMQGEDWVIDMKLHAELRIWKERFTISTVVNLLLVVWITATWSFRGPPIIVLMRSGANSVVDGMVTFVGTRRINHILWLYYCAKLFAH